MPNTFNIFDQSYTFNTSETSNTSNPSSTSTLPKVCPQHLSWERGLTGALVLCQVALTLSSGGGGRWEGPQWSITFGHMDTRHCWEEIIGIRHLREHCKAIEGARNKLNLVYIGPIVLCRPLVFKRDVIFFGKLTTRTSIICKGVMIPIGR